MGDWSGELSAALESGDPAYMKAMLARVPAQVLKQAIPLLDHLAKTSAAQGRLVAAMKQAAGLEPDNAEVARTIDALEASPRPTNPDDARVEGLRQLLLRYSGQLSPSHALARLADPHWLAAWDKALASLAGERVVFSGSELGVFALRALKHGAVHALCAEAYPLDARIAAGMAQKHFLQPWRELHGAAIQAWSEQERIASFGQFASAIDVAGPDAEHASADCLVFPNIDHTLLGTGIVAAVRKHKAARVLPARATVYATGIQWLYPAAEDAHDAMNALRWSLYPKALDLGADMWAARTAQVPVGSIDFLDFTEAAWDLSLPVTSDGTVDAIVFWFDLELGNARVSNAPRSPLACIKPAVQHIDSIKVSQGDAVPLHVQASDTRMHFDTRPASSHARRQSMPDWYVAQLGDRSRSEAYRQAIGSALERAPGQMVLDVGAGCGHLARFAADAGAAQVVGCEANAILAGVGAGLDQRVTVQGKDCRKLEIPADLPRRADLAVFESFDCSLIGEGVLHFLAHAREHLLAPGARIVPAAARIRAMLVEYRSERILDIDAALLNPYRAAPSFIGFDAGKADWRALSAPFDVFEFDFSTAGPEPQEQTLALHAAASGIASGILFWFDLGFGQDAWLSNAPQDADGPHWKQGLQFLPEVRVEPGMALPLAARHDGSALKFHWQAAQLPPEACASKVPMCDPRWLAASAELEQQAGSLLQHCAQHPGEREKVAAIAARFAADPAAHGIDPVIAQRFATMFQPREA